MMRDAAGLGGMRLGNEGLRCDEMPLAGSSEVKDAKGPNGMGRDVKYENKKEGRGRTEKGW